MNFEDCWLGNSNPVLWFFENRESRIHIPDPLLLGSYLGQHTGSSTRDKLNNTKECFSCRGGSHMSVFSWGKEGAPEEGVRRRFWWGIGGGETRAFNPSMDFNDPLFPFRNCYVQTQRGAPFASPNLRRGSRTNWPILGSIKGEVGLLRHRH